MPGNGRRVLGAGCLMPDAVCRVLGAMRQVPLAWRWMPGAVHRVLSAGC